MKIPMKNSHGFWPPNLNTQKILFPTFIPLTPTNPVPYRTCNYSPSVHLVLFRSFRFFPSILFLFRSFRFFPSILFFFRSFRLFPSILSFSVHSVSFCPPRPFPFISSFLVFTCHFNFSRKHFCYIYKQKRKKFQKIS